MGSSRRSVPEDFACGERFDAILVTSLFTHLPEERFVAWLRVLWGLLTPGGVLAFSTHSPQILPPDVAMPGSGILFAELSESGSLETSDYGSTWVTEDFVRSALARAAGPAPASLHRLDRGLNNFQDLYVAVPGADVDFSGLGFRGDPLLFVEHCTLQENGRRLYLDGWAVERAGSAEKVEVLARRERSPRRHHRTPGRRGRRARRGALRPLGLGLLVPPSARRVPELVRPRPPRGGRPGRGPPAPGEHRGRGPPRALPAKIGLLDAEVARAHERIVDVEARAAAAIAALEARVAAMEASRFWKMRNAWFRVKRFLGLTTEA